MTRWASRVRLTPVQLGIVGVVSTLATALIVVAATGRTAAQSAALAALHRPPVAVQGAGGGNSAGASEPALNIPADASPATRAASPQSASAQQSGGGSGAAASTPTITTTTTTTSTPTPGTNNKPAVSHVFVIALSTSSYDAAFGPASVARYLNGTLKPQGTLLGGYESLGGTGLADYLALISGQAPNADTQTGCPAYADFPAGTAPAADGTLAGVGCVYPNTVLTIGDQVTSAGHQWRAYIEDLGSAPCPHPDSGAVDDAAPHGTGAEYDGRHNPFIYFHSLLDLGGCASDDVSLTQLPRDLHRRSSTPTYAYIAPGACAEASATSCPGGGPVGLVAEDAFLRKWVPVITRSVAYKQGGALLITFSPAIGTIGTTPAANDPIPTGALVLSRFTPKNRTVSAVYNPYSVLRAADDLLGYKPLALAAKAKSLVGKVFKTS